MATAEDVQTAEQEDVGTAEQELPICDMCIFHEAPPPDAGLPPGTDCGRMGAGGYNCTAPNGDVYYCTNRWQCMPADP